VSFPYFISPEQAMRERSELARKGISRGRSVVALAYADGVLFVAENPSRSLQKVSELYDRVGFAAVGRFNEFDNLPTRRHGPTARQQVRAGARHDLHRAGQAVRG
jgi:proteasome alpha subunit